MKTKINSIIFILLGICFSISSVSAQPPRRQDMGNRNEKHRPTLPDSARIIQMVDELVKELSLTEAQKTKISQLHFAHFKEAKEQLELEKKNRENHHQQMETLRKEFEEQVKSVLNNSQIEQFEAFLRTHGPKDRRPPKGEEHESHK